MKKIAIVTGASSGMGKDFALQIPSKIKIDEIWLLARRKDKLDLLAEEIKKMENAPHPRPIEMDISGKSGIQQYKTLLDCEKSACQATGGFEISILVNNAGYGTYGTFEETELEKELNMIELNCTSLTGLCGISIPYMNKDSVIINTASLASFLPLGNFAVYGATKSYVLSFTMALRAELSPKGIKVCALCPGPVSTEFANVASNGSRKNVKHGLDSEKVVSHCLKRALNGKATAIYAFKWKFKAFASRFVGRYFGAWFTWKYCKRPNGKNGIS